MKFADCERLLSSAKNQDFGKPIANNTRLYRVDDDMFGVKLHNTFVVYVLRNGTYQLDAGGWRTITTKERINRFSPAHVIQKNNVWYVVYGGEKFVFEDMMLVDENGKPIGGNTQTEEADDRMNMINKLVSDYITGFCQAIERGEIGVPGPGDCWGCFFRNTTGGSQPFGVDHFFSHFQENYYVPSLLYGAILDRGYRDPSFIWNVCLNDAEFARSILQSYFTKLKPQLHEVYQTLEV